MQVLDGTVAAPGVAFASDTDTGMYRDSANEVILGAGGAGILLVDNGGITLPASLDGFWSVQSSGNQACDTTCTNGAAVVGFDSDGGNMVATSSALADECLCAGN